MSTFRTVPRRKPGDTYYRTLEDRKDRMREQLAKGYSRTRVQDDPSHGLRWNYGHWEVYVSFHGKVEYVGSSIDKELAIELRSIAIEYKLALLGIEAESKRRGEAYDANVAREKATAKYHDAELALRGKIQARNLALRRMHREAKIREEANRPSYLPPVAKALSREEAARIDATDKSEAPADSPDHIRSPAEQVAFERSQIEGMVASAKAGRHEVEGA